MRLALVGDWLKLGRGLGNLFSDVTRGWYLQGFYENHYFTKNELIDDFMFTAAHESGHSILASYAYKSTRLSNYSWVHKGSSKGIGSGYSLPKSNEKGYELYLGGKADLIKYYSYPTRQGYEPLVFYAIEYDIKNLIWLSKLTFRR
jgi:hypothetical protein